MTGLASDETVLHRFDTLIVHVLVDLYRKASSLSHGTVLLISESLDLADLWLQLV